MLKILYDLSLTQETACIYTNCNDMSKFIFGSIIAVNEKEIAIQMISPNGEDDGITVMNVDNVFRIETNSQYGVKMNKLTSKNIIPSYNLLLEDNNIKTAALLFAFNRKQVVSIELLDSGYNDVVGFIRGIDEKECIIEQIDEYGYSDGISYLCVKDITKISFLTQDEKRIMFLFDNQEIKNTGDGSLIDE